jgi:hypothetical protein
MSDAVNVSSPASETDRQSSVNHSATTIPENPLL